MYVNDFNSRSLLAILFFVVFTFTSCKKDAFTVFKNGSFHPGSPVVFVAGYESNGTNNVAKYWIDGQGICLTDGTYNATATSIFVSDNDVYVSGYDNGAVYWKNNREIRLSDGIATSIFVSGNDVYVAGSGVSSSSNPVYWKNGIEVPLEKFDVNDSSIDFGVNSIFVSGNDVYAAGFEHTTPVYWKNGKEIYSIGLYNPESSTDAISIYVSGQDVYMDGIYRTAGSPFPVFWFEQNGTPYNGIIANPFAPGGGNSLFVSGTHVYIGGTQYTPPHYYPAAAYWKDGNIFSLPSSETSSFGNAIAASGNHVYEAGYEIVSNQDTYAVYWKDSTEIKLTDGTHAAVANSIFVK